MSQAITPPLHQKGLAEVEAEHALQFRLLTTLEESIANQEWSRLHELVDQLYNYSEVHFASEQVLMRLHSYPGYYAHEREHGDLLRQLRDLADTLRIPGGEQQLNPAQFRQWLESHIHSADLAFEGFVRRTPGGPLAAGAEHS